MGDVYKARDTRLDRVIAIKQMKGQHSARFQQEAHAVAVLNHPNICMLHDVGPDYLVMEYVEGKRLAGPLRAEEAVRLALQIASALEEAHGRGILHRDLKPENILVTPKGTAKLLDFGLAKLMTDADAELHWSRFPSQLINAGDGSHLWSERYDRDMNDIFAIQDEIGQAISEALKVRLAPRAQVVNIEAYQNYLKGQYYLQRVTPESLAKAKECLSWPWPSTRITHRLTADWRCTTTALGCSA